MSQIKPFHKEKLFAGFITSPKSAALDELVHRLEELLGPVDYQSESIPYIHTSYYEEEMGKELNRYFISFKHLIDPLSIVDVKLKTVELEKEFSLWNGSRTVNIDPGLMGYVKCILSSAKNRYSAIPLRDGVYAELALIFRKQQWYTFPWTYPDFKTKEYKDILTHIRGLYWQQLQGLNAV